MSATFMPFKGESFPSYVAQSFKHSSGKARGRSTTGQRNDGDELKDGCDEIVELSGRNMLSVGRHRASTSSAGTKQSAKEVGVSKPGMRIRPSLTEQLKQIVQQADEVTQKLKQTHRLPHKSPSSHHVHQSSNVRGFQATTTQLRVAQLTCRFPCPVTFMLDCCIYLFQHPFITKEIEMIMYYRDMRAVKISLQDRSLRFRIDHSFEQFGTDYNPTNPHHTLCITFAALSDAKRVKAHLKQFMPRS